MERSDLGVQTLVLVTRSHLGVQTLVSEWWQDQTLEFRHWCQSGGKIRPWSSDIGVGGQIIPGSSDIGVRVVARSDFGATTLTPISERQDVSCMCCCVVGHGRQKEYSGAGL